MVEIDKKAREQLFPKLDQSSPRVDPAAPKADAPVKEAAPVPAGQRVRTVAPVADDGDGETEGADPDKELF